MTAVRWDGLFADLEASVEAEDRAAFEAEVADLARAERAALALADRLHGSVGAALVLHLADGDRVTGEVVGAGRDWVVLRTPGGPVLVPLAAVGSVAGLGRAAAPPADPQGPPRLRLGLAAALRVLARDRAYVQVTVRDGAGAAGPGGAVPGGTVLGGTVDRVGADHLDLALHPADEPRRRGAVLGVRTVPFGAVVSVRGGAVDRH